MEKAKRTITVCTGTTCYVMGAAELIGDLEEAVENGRLKAGLRGSTCLGHCKDRANGAPPFVELDGAPLSAATLESVAEEIIDHATRSGPDGEKSAREEA